MEGMIESLAEQVVFTLDGNLVEKSRPEINLQRLPATRQQHSDLETSLSDKHLVKYYFNILPELRGCLRPESGSIWLLPLLARLR